MDITPEQIQSFVETALAIIGAAAALDAVLPPQVRGVLMMIKTLLAIIGANWGHARNAEESPVLEEIRLKRKKRNGKPPGK